MRSPAWFRLAVRLLGVLFLGLAFPNVMYMLSKYLSTWTVMRQMPGYGTRAAEILGSLIAVTAIVPQLWLGWYLLFRGERLIRYVLKDARDRCPDCCYSTRGLTSAACPECGCPLQPHAAPPSGDTLGPGAD